MNIIQKIQNKPRAEKLRVIWTVVIVVSIMLIAVWVVSARYYQNVPKDTSLFQTIGQGFHNVKESVKNNDKIDINEQN